MINLKWFLLCFVCNLAFGAFVPEEVALNVARSIYVENENLHDNNGFSLSSVDAIIEKENVLIYIFNLQPKGFIMVPGDNHSVPNLAFGFEHSFDINNMPENLRALMNQYKKDINESIIREEEPLVEIIEKWNYYLSDNIEPNRSRNVSPLIDAEFDQGGSWNNGVTGAIGFNGPVGCVAVSMAQIMHYWKYPEQGVGSNFYTEDDYGYIEVSFEDAFYDFDNMAATYGTTPSQLLLFHAGVAVNMDYEFQGSGAQVVGSYPSAFYAMENFFAYNSDIYYEWKDNHTTSEYRQMIKNELDYNRPVISQGFGSTYSGGGHAWNIDGYSGNNLHCNWGWGGSSNGYYSLTSMGGFPDDQAVIMGLIPQMDPLVALFEYEVDEATVSFLDLSGMINNAELDIWSWDFGDGNTSSNASPSHTYDQAGNYEVSLVIYDIYGQASEPHEEIIQILSGGMPGDINVDSIINILDIVLVVNFVLNSDTPTATEFLAADLNNDGTLNILDIVGLTNLILGA